MSSRIDWPFVIARAATIVESYRTQVTLRQAFYRLVAAGLIPNAQSAYKRLSARTAEDRRAGTFPDLADHTRSVYTQRSWTSPRNALDAIAEVYRRDRTEGQENIVVLGVEKATLAAQMWSWFGRVGVPIVVLRGYSSQSYVDTIRARVRHDGRPAVLLYAGDHDPSGEDIDRDFIERTDCWVKVERVALTAAQVVEYRLSVMPGKATDSRAAGFVARHGELRQVEVEALDPDDLRRLFRDALATYWDLSTYRHALTQEYRDRAQLRAVAADLDEEER